MIRLSKYLLALASIPLFADPPQPVVVNAVTDQYRPLSFDQEKLAGLLARRMRANAEGYLEHFDDPLSIQASESRSSDAAGRSMEDGKVLEAIANAYEYRRDPKLRAVMDRLAKQLLAAQRKEWHSAAPNSDEHWASKELLTRKYDLLGLLAYYHLTDNEDALVAARKIGDLLVGAFSKSAADRSKYRSEYRLAAVLIEPLVFLYRYTEENRYLDLCRSTADAWLQSAGTLSNLTTEDLSSLHGLVELYRITGDESYFRPVRAAWTEVRNRRLSLAGSPLPDHDGSSGRESDACATLAWMQLSLNLLRVTGEAQYGEQLERTIYNQLFAGQDVNTGVILAPTPLNGTKRPAPKSDACAASEAQGVALIPSAVWGRYGNGIAVVLYNAGRATFALRRRGTVQIYSETNYPESGEFLLHVEPGHNLRFPLRLRVPAWTSNFRVEFGGSRLNGEPGTFLTINREWKPGDTVKIMMDMTAQLLTGAGDYADQIAVQRGPQILALPKTLNPQLRDLTNATLMAADAIRPSLTPVANTLPFNWAGDQAYTMAGEYEGKAQQLVLTPFADAKTCRVWLRRSGASTGATN